MVVAEGATGVAYLGPLTSKSKVTQLESEDEFTAVADCTGDDVLELVTEQGGAPDYLCMHPCSGDFSEVLASKTQLLERPGVCGVGEGIPLPPSSSIQTSVCRWSSPRSGDVCCSKPSWAASSSPPPGNMITIYLETG
eukprot:scaffold9705_cov36-Phaeocystis_antarctica.AAC.1